MDAAAPKSTVSVVRDSNLAGTSPRLANSMNAGRKQQLQQAARAYFDALRQKNFDLIPYTDNVILRAPLAPGGVHNPLAGRENLRARWWAPLPGLLAEVHVFDVFDNDALTHVMAKAEIQLTNGVVLRVADLFKIDDNGMIVEQENHFDPRDVTHPGWNQ
jgi:hypothetical protein